MNEWLQYLLDLAEWFAEEHARAGAIAGGASPDTVGVPPRAPPPPPTH